MKIIDAQKNGQSLRADMFLPNWLMGFGIVLDIAAVAFLVAACVTQNWMLLIGVGGAGVLGVFAHLCWKNQTIRILSESTFEYTTLFGKTTVYAFSDIKGIRVNEDSFTMFVGDGKVHIESIAILSQRLFDKIDQALERSNCQ